VGGPPSLRVRRLFKGPSADPPFTLEASRRRVVVAVFHALGPVTPAFTRVKGENLGEGLVSGNFLAALTQAKRPTAVQVLAPMPGHNLAGSQAYRSLARLAPSEI